MPTATEGGAPNLSRSTTKLDIVLVESLTRLPGPLTRNGQKATGGSCGPFHILLDELSRLSNMGHCCAVILACLT